MKKLFITALALTLLCMGSTASAQETKVKKEDNKLKAKTTAADGKESKVKVEDDKMVIKSEDMGQNMVYPYKATYSSQFAPGAPAHSKLILDMWKAWDDNAFDRVMAHVADTVMQELPDGTVIKGKENFFNTGKQYRDRYATVKSTVEAWMPVKSLDRNEDFVLVWGSEEDTDKDGKVTTTRFHEVWGLNKDGKIIFMRQYASQPIKQ
jgi:hypothetical protein